MRCYFQTIKGVRKLTQFLLVSIKSSRTVEIKMISRLIAECSIIALLLSVGSCAVSYCDMNKRLCNLTGYQHITCESKGAFAPDCPPNAQLVKIDAHIERILNEHNKKRNEIAGGKTYGFNAALKMPTLVSSTTFIL